MTTNTITLPRVIGVSRDAESPSMSGVLVSFERPLSDDQLRALPDLLARRSNPSDSVRSGEGAAAIQTWQSRCTDGKHNFASFNEARDAEIADLRAALAATQASPAVAPSKQDAIRQALAELASLSPEQLQAELASHKGKLRLEAPTAAALSHQAAAPIYEVAIDCTGATWAEVSKEVYDGHTNEKWRKKRIVAAMAAPKKGAA